MELSSEPVCAQADHTFLGLEPLKSFAQLSNPKHFHQESIAYEKTFKILVGLFF